jgi:Phasin protein.
MEKAKNSQPTDLFAALIDNAGLPQAAVRQADQWLRAHQDFLNGFERVAQDWLKRRRESNDEALEAVERMCGCTDVGEMLVVYSDWLGGSLRRLSEDAAALNEQCLAMATSTFAAGAAQAKAEPHKKTAKPKAKAAKPAVKAAKATPTKPVKPIPVTKVHETPAQRAAS